MLFKTTTKIRDRILVLFYLLFPVFLLCQNTGINYKALIHDNNGNPLANSNVTVQFDILEGAGLTSVYSESHAATTDDNGIIVVIIGEGTPVSGNYNTINWSGNEHALNVKVDSGSGLVDMGTNFFQSVPYALNVSGLETLDEGNGIGWRLKDRNTDFYGNVGLSAIDLSRSVANDQPYGATGPISFATGSQVIASGNISTAIGFGSIASGDFSFALGDLVTASGENSVALGRSTSAQAMNSTVLGRNNIGGGSPTGWIDTDPLFEIGNGLNTPSNALTVLKNGTVTAPSLDPFEITDPRALVTKEYGEANFQSSGLEKIFEAGGAAWRLIGRDPTNYGEMQSGAVDLSYSSSASSTLGATGTYSFATGLQTTADGYASTAFGNLTMASGSFSLASGVGSEANGERAVALGNYTNADAYYSTAVGSQNIGGGSANSWVDTDPIFEVGNGEISASNALTILKNGTVTAPSLDLFEITHPRALITKEYGEANFQSSGLEKIFEAGGAAWRLIGRDPTNYGEMQSGAVDLSYSSSASSTLGATGTFSFATGLQTTAGGYASTAFGNLTVASGGFSLASGVGSEANGERAVALGNYTNADSYYSTAVGSQNIGGGSANSWVDTDPIFEVGNGEFSASNALTVLKNGTVTAPSFDPFEITHPRALITKEYGEANFQSSGLEKITDGQIGWRLVGSDPNNFGSIGASAVDLSKSFSASTEYGASGGHAFASGQNVIASGNYSTAMGLGSTAAAEHSIAIGRNASTSSTASNALAIGYLSSAEGVNSISLGFGGTASGALSATLGGSGNVASGSTSTALGYQNISDDQYGTVVGYRNDNTVTNTSLFQVGNGTSSTRSNAFTVFYNGNALLSGTLTQNSDRRLKKDIRPIKYGLQEVLSLQSVSYSWKRLPENRKSLGLIAQDVKKVIPEIVFASDDDQETLSLSYTELIPILIKAIQEQQVLILEQQKTLQEFRAELKMIRENGDKQ